MKSYLILIVAVITNFISQLFFAELAKEVSFDLFSIVNLKTLILSITFKFHFWMASSLFGLGALLWIIGIKKIALAKAFSIASLNYVFIFFYSFFILKEGGSIYSIASCLLIVSGVLLLAKNETLFKRWKKRQGIIK